ncbi:MAG TPA: MgtC/SapB family protein [Ignavibacteriaceae bacterium]|nr:MgtC/SapB family protein [Ignavibacteriaceae bacterium]
MQDTLKHIPGYLTSSDSFLGSGELLILMQKLAIAILIGAFIGLEREHSRPENEKAFAGIRTFPLISIFGFLAALVSAITTPWIYFALFLGFASLVVASHIFSAKEGKMGTTTEVTAFIVFILGSLVLWNFVIIAAVIGVIVTIFLTLKIQLHEFVGKVNSEDIYAALKLAIITVVILPLLPNQTYGPFNVLNPRLIWYMVIFISGIGFIGYLLIKIYGENKGIVISGLLGGMISSTAVAVSFSRKSKEQNELSLNFAAGIILASTIMFPRIFFIVLVFNNSLIGKIWIPLLISTAAGLAASYILSKKFIRKHHHKIEFKNPFELKSALIFGLIFAAVVFISKAAQIYLGTGGIYAASAIGGLTSVDAIILTLSRLSGLSENTAAAGIIIAAVANTIAKGIIASILGTDSLRKYVITGLGIITLITAAAFLITAGLDR